MPRIDVVLENPGCESFRVRQVQGMFDVPPDVSRVTKITAELPALDDDWKIGAIVGPSGSGKTSIAKAAFAGMVYQPASWRTDLAAIDQLGDRPLVELAELLTSVGFGSPPAWLRPPWALSTGERFRLELARAIVGTGTVVVFDEFTSVVDRTTAQMGSAALAKVLRKKGGPRFVAVSCHEDILPWLQPDWVLDMATCQLARGKLQRPCINLDVHRCGPAAWRVFRKHHYLSGALPGAAENFVAFWNDRPVAFCAAVGLYGKRGHKRICRLVTLPDFQGLGIGRALAAHVAQRLSAAGWKVSITASHPGVVRRFCLDGCWRFVRVSKAASGNNWTAPRHGQQAQAVRSSQGRIVVTLAYVPAGQAE